MFTQTLRKSLKRQEGQALVLACLTVLILSIAVITTVNIGHTVHEKIRLQNNADAAAYSMAAVESRAFNFYAFANRTQASHYVGAMTWQSVISFMFFVEAFMTDAYGVIKTLNPCVQGGRNAFWTVACPILEALPYVGVVIRIINRAAGLIRTFVQQLQNMYKRIGPPIDRAIGKVVIPLHRYLNGAMYAASLGMMASAASHVVTTKKDIIDANDINVQPLWGALATGAVSACNFTRAHMKEMRTRNPMGTLDVRATGDDNKEARAKRVMGYISNATRYACTDGGFTCLENFNTSRKLSDIIPAPAGAREFMDWILGGIPKFGQTRFLYRSMRRGKLGQDYNYIRDATTGPNDYAGPLAPGDNLGADDIYWIKLGPASLGPFTNPLSCEDDDPYDGCWGDPREDRERNGMSKLRRQLETSVWATNDTEVRGGIHWRLAYLNGPRVRGWRMPSAPYPEKNLALNRRKVCVLDLSPIGCVPGPKISVYSANTRPLEDGNHPWQGLAPFMHFEPGQYQRSCPAGITESGSVSTGAKRDVEFNQPSTWVGLNKDAQKQRNPTDDGTGATHNDPSLVNDEGKIKMGLSGAGTELDMLNDGSFLGLEGLNVISRGQSYYHRPGNWAEMPNFFNPYWRPRLASIYQGRLTLPFMSRIEQALPGPIRNIPYKIITH